jgi:cytochrome c553
MRAALYLVLVMLGMIPSARVDDEPPAWAYPVNPDFKPAPDDGQPRRVPGSDITYFVPQTRDRFFAPDWHPADHMPMPEVVAHGRKPGVYACGFCHRADGPGGPENADLAGLPEAYILEQMEDLKSGRRGTSVAKRPPDLMVAVAKAASDEEAKAAATYFASLQPRATVRIVESETAPKTHVAGVVLADAGNGEREPIAGRIIEMPEDTARFENRDSHVGFVAYVPIGSVARGERLASSAGGAGCVACHGTGLKGTGNVPQLAGRSPSYLFRQLYDFKHGARTGSAGAPMIEIAVKLSTDDMTALVAYAASLPR